MSRTLYHRLHTRIFDNNNAATPIQKAWDALDVIAISIICIISFGLPFYYRDRLTRQVSALDRDMERGRAPVLERPSTGWKTIRIASAIICAGVGIPAFTSYYYSSWPSEGKWAEIFLILSVVLSASSFVFSTILITSFRDWSGDITELRSHISTWSTLFSLPNIGILWSIILLLMSFVAWTAENVVFASSLDYFETAVTIFMIVIGIAVTVLFYLVYAIWRS